MQYLWNQFIELHPADIAEFLADLDKTLAQLLFTQLPGSIQLEVFEHSSNNMRSFILSKADDQKKADLLNATPVDELTDLFESVSTEDLKEYLTLLNMQDRKKVLSLMEFDPQSAAGIMDMDIVTFREDFTVDQSIKILQRLKPKVELHHQIFVINTKNQLVGHINLEDLVLKNPTSRLSSFMYKNELVAQAQEDQEAIAKKMIHYHQMTVPVVGDNDVFLGAIPEETLVEIIEKEASEDVYHMSAMAALTKSYFETSFFRLLYERSFILILLLLAQTFSTMIIDHYEATLAGFLIFFITMLTSTGGNSSSQTSAIVIQGMASGEIRANNIKRFLAREFRMAVMIALLLGIFSFVRVYLTYRYLLGSFVVSLSLSVIVLFSVILGSAIPIVLKGMKVDPAFAAGPFLATIMDIMGLLIYCYISSYFFG